MPHVKICFSEVSTLQQPTQIRELQQEKPRIASNLLHDIYHKTGHAKGSKNISVLSTSFITTYLKLWVINAMQQCS